MNWRCESWRDVNSSEATKICTKCELPKLLGEFYANRLNPNQKMSQCKSCICAYQRQQRKAHPATVKEIEHRSRTKNRETQLASARKIYYASREKRLRQLKAWRLTSTKYKQAYGEANNARRMRKGGIPGSHTPEEWEALCKSFDYRCVCCGRSGDLTRDHVVPISNPSSSDFISNIQPLCNSCNCSKRDRHTVDYRANPFTGKGQSLLFA